MKLTDMLTLRIGRYKLRPFSLAWWVMALVLGAAWMAVIWSSWAWTMIL